MPLSFPQTARTDADRLAYAMRVREKMIALHQAERAKLPAELSAREIAEFKAWETTVWRPRYQQIMLDACALRDADVAKRSLDMDSAAARVGEMKDAAKTETRFDADAEKELPARIETETIDALAAGRVR